MSNTILSRLAAATFAAAIVASAPATAIMHDSLPIVERVPTSDAFAQIMSDAPVFDSSQGERVDAITPENADLIDILRGDNG